MTSTRSPTGVPPDSRMSFATRALAAAQALRSAPRSKRCEASVCRPWRRALRRTLAGSNQAASMRTFLVSAVIMESQPPMTPARPCAREWSATTRSSASSIRSEPSSSLTRSPLRARRTMIPPSSLSRSYAWLGWPMPCRTKLVASTALEIGLRPSRAKNSATWPVEGAMVTLRRTCAVKRPQRLWASGAICTEKGCAAGRAAGRAVSSGASGRL